MSVSADEAELNGEKVYRVGEGGYWEAVFWACSGMTLVIPLFLLAPLTAAMAAAAVVYSVVCIMRVRNAAVILTDSGLTVRNWRKAERFIPWENVVGVVYAATFVYVALSIELQSAAGKQRRQLIAMNFGGSQVTDNLRDTIVERFGFAELPQTAKGLLADRDRIWRRSRQECRSYRMR